MSSPQSLAEDGVKKEVPAWAGFVIFVMFTIIAGVCYISYERTETHEARISVLESQTTGLKGWMEKMDAKIDKILDEMRRRP